MKTLSPPSEAQIEWAVMRARQDPRNKFGSAKVPDANPKSNPKFLRPFMVRTLTIDLIGYHKGYAYRECREQESSFSCDGRNSPQRPRICAYRGP